MDVYENNVDCANGKIHYQRPKKTIFVCLSRCDLSIASDPIIISMSLNRDTKRSCFFLLINLNTSFKSVVRSHGSYNVDTRLDIRSL